MADTVSIIKVKSDSGVDTSGLFGGGKGAGKTGDTLLTLGLLAGSAVAGYFIVSKLSEAGVLDNLSSQLSGGLEGIFSDINSAISEGTGGEGDGGAGGDGGTGGAGGEGGSGGEGEEEESNLAYVDTDVGIQAYPTYAYPYSMDNQYSDCGSSIDPLFGPRSSYRYQSPSDYIIDF